MVNHKQNIVINKKPSVLLFSNNLDHTGTLDDESMVIDEWFQGTGFQNLNKTLDRRNLAHTELGIVRTMCGA